MTEAPRSLRSVSALVGQGLVRGEEAPVLEEVAARFQVGLTPEVAALVDPTDPHDPIGLQYLPQAAELSVLPEERTDPIGDAVHSPLPGLTHRYPDRVLLKPVLLCPVYCRFCFRREVVGGSGRLSEAELEAALAYIEEHEEIWEVILTGGDPLILSPGRLQALITRLSAIPHLGHLRVHTRVPVVAPGRIDAAMTAALSSGRTLSLVLHSNHPRELTEAAAAALGRLSGAGIPLLSQSVLLRGVNDRVEILEALFRRLVELRVRPYYLHHGDLAEGTGHFRTTLPEGQALMAALRTRLSGVALPTYVLDIPGGFGKVPVDGDHVVQEGEGWRVRDPAGRWHVYPPVRPPG